jgi:hypothetical protein
MRGKTYRILAILFLGLTLSRGISGEPLTYRILGILFLGLTLSRGISGEPLTYRIGFVNVIQFWGARFIQKLDNEAARCVFYYLTCVIHYDRFVGFKCVLEIIMFEYDTGK